MMLFITAYTERLNRIYNIFILGAHDDGYSLALPFGGSAWWNGPMAYRERAREARTYKV